MHPISKEKLQCRIEFCRSFTVIALHTLFHSLSPSPPYSSCFLSIPRSSSIWGLSLIATSVVKFGIMVLWFQFRIHSIMTMRNRFLLTVQAVQPSCTWFRFRIFHQCVIDFVMIPSIKKNKNSSNFSVMKYQQRWRTHICRCAHNRRLNEKNTNT